MDNIHFEVIIIIAIWKINFIKSDVKFSWTRVATVIQTVMMNGVVLIT